MNLFRPAWDSKNEERAVKAANKLKDGAKLASAAKKARFWRARIAAFKKLNDKTCNDDTVISGVLQSLGNDLKNSSDEGVRMIAAQMLLAIYKSDFSTKHKNFIEEFNGTLIKREMYWESIDPHWDKMDSGGHTDYRYHIDNPVDLCFDVHLPCDDDMNIFPPHSDEHIDN